VGENVPQKRFIERDYNEGLKMIGPNIIRRAILDPDKIRENAKCAQCGSTNLEDLSTKPEEVVIFHCNDCLHDTFIYPKTALIEVWIHEDALRLLKARRIRKMMELKN
jgi:hypothetical protein